jgi:tRNA pseudouridine32 synthase/23S rRNA pseudouridine746 synthase
MNALEATRSRIVCRDKGMAEKVMRELSEGPQAIEGLRLVHQDEHLLVIDKPAGLLSVPGRGADKQDCAWARVRRQVPDALVVHRLDMATSGLLLLARGIEAQRRLSAAFAQRQVGKRYLAVVAGRPGAGHADNEGWQLIDLPLAADWPNRPRRIVDPVHGKPSQTRWRVLAFEAASDRTRLELEPLTGRSHQLRVHLQALGHPIVGDHFYAPPPVRDAAPRLLLHASELRLAHPFTGEPMHWRSAAPF